MCARCGCCCELLWFTDWSQDFKVFLCQSPHDTADSSRVSIGHSPLSRAAHIGSPWLMAAVAAVALNDNNVIVGVRPTTLLYCWGWGRALGAGAGGYADEDCGLISTFALLRPVGVTSFCLCVYTRLVCRGLYDRSLLTLTPLSCAPQFRNFTLNADLYLFSHW